MTRIREEEDRSYASLSTWHGAVPGWWVSRIEKKHEKHKET